MATKRVSDPSPALQSHTTRVYYSSEGCVRLNSGATGSQWADEVINAKEKTTLTGEAKELEQEIELRKEGLHRCVYPISSPRLPVTDPGLVATPSRLQLAAERYHKSISKKKVSPALDDSDKLLPREAFGITMVRHGEDFDDDSLLGQALITFGRAFCNIATAQEALGRTLGSSLIIALERFLDQIKDYEAERKKLETRRLNRDAAMKQVERVENNKKAKEKDRREAQEELEKSEFRYDEAELEVQSRIEAIQQNEIDQIRELGSLLHSELNYAEQYTQILRDVKDNWPGREQIANLMEPRRPIGPMYDFSREGAESPGPKIRSRASSKARTRSRSPSSDSAASIDDVPSPRPRSRKGSSGSVRSSRKRSDSQTTTGSAVDVARDKREKDEKKKGSWSVWGRNGPKKDREQFTSLRSGDDDESDSSDSEGTPGSPTQVSRSASLLSLGKWSKSQQNNTSARIPALGPRTRGRETEGLKVVRAVSDYRGSSDELSFHTGDEIVVVGEVIDGWMMGQLDGKKGLFPSVYTEPITTKSHRAPSKPPAAPTSSLLPRKLSSKASSDAATDSLSGSRQTLVDSDTSIPPRSSLDTAHARTTNTERDDINPSHPFGDHHAMAQYTDSEHGPLTSASLGSGYGHSYDSESLAESAADESEQEQSRLVRRRASDDDGFVVSRNQDNASSGHPKKVPPPLPRRQTDVRKAPPPPPPPRRPDVRAPPPPPVYGLQDSQTGDCMNFVQAVGRATGMCVNCQRMHIN
ncbi:hypothetical protein F5148DRAFT_1282466 [Russula earlei]|uniref:Uncharacterized protein n=1 Tax=Russula earlei TaxID=71964 RepID=A0ACC0UEA2_9AGAM|nr:hypothetical protein F5148DRAFT_1282466 [Russula earlei]